MGIHLSVKRGRPIRREFVIKRNGVPTDITDYTVIFSIKKPRKTTEQDDSEAPLYVLTNEPGDHSDPGAGKTAFILNPEDVKPGDYSCDLWWDYDGRPADEPNSSSVWTICITGRVYPGA